MIYRHLKNTSWYEFESLQNYKDILRHAVLTRATDINDFKTIKGILAFTADPISFEEQLHGIKVWTVNKKNLNEKRKGDALITKDKNIPLMIRIADCASIFLFDPKLKIIANVHAGWRGFAQRIIHKAIRQLNDLGCNTANLLACVSPMIGSCCSTFSNPYEELPKFLHKFITEENTVDLWSVVDSQLRECGLRKNNIENARLCTSCNIEEFFSSRREREKSGRFGTVIMLK